MVQPADKGRQTMIVKHPDCAGDTVYTNRSTRILGSALGILVGIGSAEHGLLECMQGFHRTPGVLVNALGAGHTWTTWKQGGEGAFTLLPNFLITGIVAGTLGVAMIALSVRFLGRQRGPLMFLLLGSASFLTGGGVAQVVFIILTWGVASRIHTSLGFWQRLTSEKLRGTACALWPWTLTASIFLFLAALEIAVFGYVPGIRGQTELLHACWSVLALALTLYLVSVVSGFVCDVNSRGPGARGKAAGTVSATRQRL
jgi:hypothetical protein